MLCSRALLGLVLTPLLCVQVDESNDRPTDPPKITSVEVLWNPFEDIVPRTTAAERRAQEQFK